MSRDYRIKVSEMPGGNPGTEPFAKLKDDSIMPYGKYGPKGDNRKMKDVPPGYLLYIWDVDDGLWLDGPYLGKNQKAVRAYILESFGALELDCPDFNIKHHPKKMEPVKTPKPPRYNA